MKLTKDLEDINKGLSVFAYLSLDSDKSVCYFFFFIRFLLNISSI